MLTPEVFRGAKVLLQPSFAAEETIGFFDKSFQNVMEGDVEIRKELYAMSLYSSSCCFFTFLNKCRGTRPMACDVRCVSFVAL